MIVSALEFLVRYDVVILPVLFAAVWVFGVANWTGNVYRSQNKKFARCARSVAADGRSAALYVAQLPKEYHRQWRAYVNGNADRPSQVFEFVPRKNKIIFVHLLVASCLGSACYLALFVMDVGRRDYLIFQVAFALAVALVILVNKNLFARKERTARQAFGGMVARLNAALQSNNTPCPQAVVRRLEDWKKNPPSDTLERASELLRQSGERTVAEQQQINLALNGLLQSYARAAARAK